MSMDTDNLQSLEYPSDEDREPDAWSGMPGILDYSDDDYVPPDEDENDDDDGFHDDIEEDADDISLDGQVEALAEVADLLSANPVPPNDDDSPEEDVEEDATPYVNLGEARLTLAQLQRLFSLAPGLVFSRARQPARVESESDSEDDKLNPSGWSQEKGAYKDSRVPTRAGVKLLRSGDFGRTGLIRGLYAEDEDASDGFCTRLPHHTPLANVLRRQQTSTRRVYRDQISRHFIPNSHGTTVATYSSNPYCGQYSLDSSFYYTCTKDFQLHIYDTTVAPHNRRTKYINEDHSTNMKVIKSMEGSHGSWTITDSHLSPNNEWLIYSSLTSTIYMAKLNDPTEEQIPVHLATGPPDRFGWGRGEFGIYSCRFSTDGKEIVAGGNAHLLLYDIEAGRRVVKLMAHEDDINSCCWADTSSGNVLVSASDDSSLKVWDRRSLGVYNKPSGVLIGHTEGITHVSPRGDGRYVISNGKDQVLRLWDLRNMRSSHEWDSTKSQIYGLPGFDYRNGRYSKPHHRSHPQDCSVMQYRGHKVLRTLIRCHFSPMETTGCSYIASGSSDGMIHIWSLDGSVVQVLNRSKSLPISFDPSAPDPAEINSTSRNRQSWGSRYECVRDVSWHSSEPVLMSCAWDTHRNGGSVARHEWKGFGKNALTLQDAVARERAQAEEYSRAADDDDDFYW